MICIIQDLEEKMSVAATDLVKYDEMCGLSYFMSHFCSLRGWLASE